MTFAALVLGWASGCGGDDDQTSDQSASIGGRVMVTGPLRGARVVVEQLRLDDASGSVREVVGETTTDADGRFSFTGLGTLNGMFIARAFGGELDDLATGGTIRLDASAELRSLFWVDLFEDREDVLVSPVGALVEALARQQLASGAASDIGAARDLAAEHIHGHFGDLDWSRIDPVSLAEPATSPVDAWRAAAVLGGYALLADDVRNAAGASPQEVNAYTHTRALAEDIGAPPFDGNDGDVRNTGLQVGTCPAVDPGCVPRPETPTFCPRGDCRTLCDLYSGTLRGQLSGAALKLVRSPDFNGSGINDTAFLPTARAIADNTDPLLFGSYCTDDVDRVGPTITIDQPPTPDADAWIKGAVQVRVRATDDIDSAPDLAFGGGLADDDGDPLNAVAATTIDTTARADGTLAVTAIATDAALNTTEVTRSFRVDNTAPVVTIDRAGFYVSGSDWWTASASPTLGGSITESNLASVTIVSGAVALGDATVDGTAWWFDVPAGTIPGVAGATLLVEATDLAGNVMSVSQRIRHDATPPALTPVNTTVLDETVDTVNFSTALDPFGFPFLDPQHIHVGAAVTLGADTSCGAASPTVTKYTYLLDENAPPYVSEANGTGPGGSNPITWRSTLTDDGVGLDPAQSEYQIRNVTSGVVVLPWRALGAGSLIGNGREYTVPVYRNGSTWPSMPTLGTDEHLYEIAIRGRDLLGRVVTLTRCWNQKLLAVPVNVGPRTVAGATSGNYGRYGFASLRLDDTVAPIDPISTLLLNNDAPGTGLMQFPVYSATTEPVFMAFDFRLPTNVSYQREEIRDRWGETARSTVNINCGSVVVDPGPPVQYGPNYTLPGCNLVAQGAAGVGVTSLSSGSVSATYTIRVFEETGPAGELTPCEACAVTSMPAPQSGYQRVVVQLPARAAPNPSPQGPRKFWIQPSIQTVAGLRPLNAAPPFAEISFVNGAVVTGQIQSSTTGCSIFQAPPTASGDWRCTRQSTNTRYRGLTRGQINMTDTLRVDVRPSRDGIAIEDIPDYFLQGTRVWDNVIHVYPPSGIVWSSSEILPPVL